MQPLVTPRAYGIKVSFEPCIGQKQLMPSYALVSNSPLTLLSLSSLFSLSSLCLFFCALFVVVFIIIVAMNILL